MAKKHTKNKAPTVAIVDIQTVLKTASIRLDETITLFAANKAVSDTCHKDVNPTLFQYVNANRFWRVAYQAFQVSLFIDIAALADKSFDCSTLQTAADLIERKKPGTVPSKILAELQSIWDRYVPFRHKVFAHTDHDRTTMADKFNAAGFTWASIDADIKTLDYIRQVLWAIHEGRQVPSRSTASARMNVAHLESMQISSEVAHLFKLIARDISQGKKDNQNSE